MNKNWEKVKLEDIAFVIMGQSPKSEFYNGEGIGLPFFQGRTEFGYIYPEVKKWCTQPLKKAKRNDVLMTVRAPVGDLNIAKEECIIGRGICSLRPKYNNGRFLYYLLKGNKSYITSFGTGAVYDAISKDLVAKLVFNIPDEISQNKIASILSAYDDLIENNLRRIKILEEIAQNIYTEWFVKFRFPGHEKLKIVDSTLGRIPEGWEVAEFRNLFEIKYGKTLPKTEFAEVGPYPVYGAGDVIGYYDKVLCQEKCALVTSRGNGSGTVWRTREAAFVTNNSLIIQPKVEFKHWDYSFVELLLKHSNVMGARTGSAQPQVTIENLNYVKAIVPERPYVEEFCSFVTPISEQVDVYLSENINLRRTRDLLLPKLISGELDVSALDIKTGDDE